MKKILTSSKEKLRCLYVDDSLFSQFVLTYGTMTAILVLLLIMKLGAKDGAVPTPPSEYWSIVINTYSPTTITFIASLIYEHSSITNNKKRGTVLFLLVIVMALTYMAFEAINVQAESNIIPTLGCICLLFPVIALLILLNGLKSTSNANSQDRQVSDGSISARR